MRINHLRACLHNFLSYSVCVRLTLSRERAVLHLEGGCCCCRGFEMWLHRDFNIFLRPRIYVNTKQDCNFQDSHRNCLKEKKRNSRGKSEIVFSKEGKIESFWPGRKKKIISPKEMAISVVARYEDPRWYNLYFGPRGGHSFPENERPFELPRQYRDKKRRRRSTLFLRFHESDLLRAQTSLLLAWLLWLFPCLAGERKKKDSREMCSNALWWCRPCRHAAFVLTRYYSFYISPPLLSRVHHALDFLCPFVTSVN